MVSKIRYSPQLQEALDIACKTVQRLDSYPMYLRQELTPVPGFMEEYVKRPTQPPMSWEEKQKRDEEWQAYLESFRGR